MFTLSGKRKLLIRLIFVLLIAGIWSAASGSLTAHASVRLTRSSKKLKYRKSFTLKVRGTKKKVSWSSSDKKIATVARTGRYTAKVKAKKKYGTAIITARAGKVILTCRVYVSKTGKISKAYRTVTAAAKHPTTGGKWKSGRYRDRNGWYLKNTFARIGKYHYYFGSDSRKKKGFFDVAGYSFWADSRGHLAVSSTPMMPNGNCYAFDANGRMVKGREIKLGSNYYYYDSNGIQAHFPRARLALLDMLPGRKGAPKNSTRMWFNNTLHSTFGPWDPARGGCLYGFDHMYNQPDFRTLDGTHYPDDMKRLVYEYIMNALGRPVKIEYTTISSTSENWTAVTEYPVDADKD